MLFLPTKLVLQFKVYIYTYVGICTYKCVCAWFLCDSQWEVQEAQSQQTIKSQTYGFFNLQGHGFFLRYWTSELNPASFQRCRISVSLVPGKCFCSLLPPLPINILALLMRIIVNRVSRSSSLSTADPVYLVPLFPDNIAQMAEGFCPSAVLEQMLLWTSLKTDVQNNILFYCYFNIC